jgi:hypothetical protein
VVEEVKWKKPSNPDGVGVWSDYGIVCMGGTLKKAARLTLPHGARLKDPKRLFNACLEGNAMRCIDLHEGESWDEAGRGGEAQRQSKRTIMLPKVLHT